MSIADGAADGVVIAAEGSSRGRLGSGATVARSALWNIAGRAGPMVVALAATPALVHLLGPTRWGLFALALSLIGLFGIFDFGIGRALTKLLAERIATDEIAAAASLTRTGLVLLTLLGLAGGIALAAAVPLWVDHGLAIPAAERPEILRALWVLCLAVPLVILNAALWGVISAFQRFRAANLVNMPILAAYYLGPLCVLHFADSLVAAMAVLVGCRALMTLGYWRICLAAMPELRRAGVDRSEVRALLRLGGWMTVSNLAWPILTYVDRFLVASVLSAAAAGYYATPSDLVGRFSLVTVAVMNSAFPAMAAAFRVDPAQAALLLRRCILAVVALLFLPALATAAFAREALTLWIGPGFAEPAAPVLRWLALAAVLGGADAVIAGFIDSVGRPDVNARFSLIELALYAPLLALLLRGFGIEGAAIACALRIALDLAARGVIAARLLPMLRPGLARVLAATAATTALVAVPLLFDGVLARLAAAAAAAALCAVLLWRCGLDPQERAALRAMLRAGLRRTPDARARMALRTR